MQWINFVETALAAKVYKLPWVGIASTDLEQAI